MHKTLKNWRAKRAGGGITVHGADVLSGEPTRITCVDAILPSGYSTHVHAVDRLGVVHKLFTD